MKRRMHRYLLTIVWILSGIAAVSAQSLSGFRESLAQPLSGCDSLGTAPAVVTVSEYGDAGAAVAHASAKSGRLRFKGWRVCIFSDNGQDAREGALEAKQVFREAFPETRVYDVYDTPYFKVTVGDCLTEEEAIILLEHVKPRFPKAFIKQEQLTLANLLH